ncbi:histidine phosphatase family protein [Arthrobacter gandavensis]|uniref:histidine phosphatase family protein n=1 Tax=Arthrobacter gandavensis TaxID=169960 RepID=UPI00188FA8BC|nr:histidine phosphatase family protein [Arthrobacter gandavensis]MBF4993306.1 histidine phosphatase family protein [Arthrobacter gandavensis]
MTRIILARHGETVWHKENRYAGSSDVALTPRGTAQARALAAWAGRQNLDAVVTSDLARAIATAQPAAAASGQELRQDTRLRELHFGHAEGLTAAEIRQAYPGVYESFLTDPALNHLPGGEPPPDAAARGLEALEEIFTAHPEARVLVVAHSTLIRLLLCSFLGIPLRHYRRVFPKLANCALTELELTAGRASLLHFNAPLPS